MNIGRKSMHVLSAYLDRMAKRSYIIIGGKIIHILSAYPGRMAKRNCVIIGGKIMNRSSRTRAASPLIKGGRAIP